MTLRTGSGYVYFVKCGEFIKIGYTEASPAARVRQIDNGSPSPVVLVGSFAGSPKDEKDLHADLQEFHHRGEWFCDMPGLRDRLGKAIS